MTKARTYLLLGICVTIVLFFISPDSYVHDLYGHIDSSIFFIYGKAWMNGMVPYTDFTEPKGPLLFLIYGCGYLLSHYDCIGVFWISCLFYLGVYCYTFKLAGIFKKDRKRQFFIAVAMSLAWFNPLVHYEVKTEDFAQLFFVVTLYYTCLLLYCDERGKLQIASLLFGISFASLFMMKFNLAGMIIILGLYILYYAWVEKRVYTSLIYMFVGGLTITLPFLVYFSIYGNGLNTFISEYFGTVFALMGATGPQEPLVLRMISFVMRPAPLIVLVVTLTGVIGFSKNLQRFRYFPLVSFLYFYFVASVYGLSYYYYSTCAMFCVFLLLWLADLCPAGMWRSKLRMYIVSACVMLIVCVTNLTRAFITPGLQDLFFQDNELRHEFYTYSYLMAQVEKPTLFSNSYLLNGQDIPSGALPVFKTIGELPGESMEIVNERRKRIKKKEVDFITVDVYRTGLIRELESYGYYRYQTQNCKKVLFSKHKLQMPPKDFHVSNLDVLLKKNIVRKNPKMRQ